MFNQVLRAKHFQNSCQSLGLTCCRPGGLAGDTFHVNDPLWTEVLLLTASAGGSGPGFALRGADVIVAAAGSGAPAHRHGPGPCDGGVTFQHVAFVHSCHKGLRLQRGPLPWAPRGPLWGHMDTWGTWYLLQVLPSSST